MPEKHTITKQQVAEALANAHLDENGIVFSSPSGDYGNPAKLRVMAHMLKPDPASSKYDHVHVSARVSIVVVGAPIHTDAEAQISIPDDGTPILEVSKRHAPVLIAQALEIAKAIGIDVEA